VERGPGRKVVYLARKQEGKAIEKAGSIAGYEIR
jgi:hypothetical protein